MQIYFDHNAAAPLCAPARAAIQQAMDVIGNPSSVHSAGRLARRLVETARTTLANTVNARPQDIAFTASGSEACQLMLNLPMRPRILATATEHAAILEAAPGVEILPVHASGLIDIGALETALGADASDTIVAVMLANNETGVIQPIKEVADIVHARNGLLAVDAAQAFGKIPIDFIMLEADMAAVSAAKVGGPLGVGAAIFRSDITPTSILKGGGQERGLRGGSENLIGIAGFGAAINAINADHVGTSRLEALRDGMEHAIAAIVQGAPLLVNGPVRLPNTASIYMPGVDAATQVMAFDLAGIAVSAGAACSSGKVGASHVLTAMGFDDDIAGGTIRVSLGPNVTEAEITKFVDVWTALYQKQQSKRAKV